MREKEARKTRTRQCRHAKAEVNFGTEIEKVKAEEFVELGDKIELDVDTEVQEITTTEPESRAGGGGRCRYGSRKEGEGRKEFGELHYCGCED